MLQNAYLDAKIGVDPAENEPRKELRTPVRRSGLAGGRLGLGTWQGIYLWEHRSAAHSRRIACHAVGTLKTAHSHSAEPPQPESAAVLLQRRNSQKLNAMVQSRHDPDAWATDGGADTDVDLLVDRLHDIAQDD